MSWSCCHVTVFRRSGRTRGGNSRVSRGRQTRNVPSKEELDLQLDQYMASTKSHLDKELDSYMNQAQDETWDWGVYMCDMCFFKLKVCKIIHYSLFISKCASVLFIWQNWNIVLNLKTQQDAGVKLLECIFIIRSSHSVFQMFFGHAIQRFMLWTYVSILDREQILSEVLVVYISTSSSAV
jgi:hypothetical protein